MRYIIYFSIYTYQFNTIDIYLRTDCHNGIHTCCDYPESICTDINIENKFKCCKGYNIFCNNDNECCSGTCYNKSMYYTCIVSIRFNVQNIISIKCVV